MQCKVQLPHPLMFSGKDAKQNKKTTDQNEMCTTLFLMSQLRK